MSYRSRSALYTGWLALLALGLLCGVVLPAVAQGASPVESGAGVVRAGDQVELRIWRDEDLSGVFTVGHNGSVVLPRLGTIAVAGRPADELQRWLREQYQEYLRHSAIEIILLRRVGVHGEVRKPDLYMVDLTVTLRDVVAMAGGLTEQGDPNKIVIVRDGERFRVGEGRTVQFMSAELQSGDQIVVGRRNWFLLNPLAIISTATTVASFLLVVFR